MSESNKAMKSQKSESDLEKGHLSTIEIDTYKACCNRAS